MQPALKLPIPAAVVSLLALSVLELQLRPITDPLAVVIAVQLVLLGTLLALPRAPTLAFVLLLLEIFVVRQFGILDLIGMAGGLLSLFVATFSAAALVPTRRVLVLAAALALHMAWRATFPPATFLIVYADTALFSAGMLSGALLQRRHARLLAVRAERDRLVAALETGPGEAATAEQLRLWSVLEQRIEPVIDGLPGLVDRARRADDPAAALELIRSRAADALQAMQATIHRLGDLPEPEPEPPVATPCAERGRTVSPLVIACGLLLVAAVIEMIAGGQVSYFAPALALLPLLTPRAPVTASALVAVAAILCSLAGEIPVAARAADFSAIITLVVAATTATPARAGASLVLVVGGLMISQGLDPTEDWPALAFIASAFIYAGHWFFGVRLRDVATEQRQVAAARVEIADAVARLQARAARAERVRIAHELHDLVGHALTAVAIQAGVAAARLKRGLQPDWRPLAVAAGQGSTELRRLATVLGHETDITAEFARITDTARATGQRVELELDEPRHVDPQVRHAVVCVAAEALTNAAKHAAGATVRVRLKAREDRLELAVDDDGGARRELPGGGRGIDSMAHRVRACGGTFRSGPRAGGGWTVQAVLPLSA